jgi:hypothetical protein
MRLHFWLTVVVSIGFLIFWCLSAKSMLHTNPDIVPSGGSTDMTVAASAAYADLAASLSAATGVLIFSLGLYVVAVVLIWSHGFFWRRAASA